MPLNSVVVIVQCKLLAIQTVVREQLFYFYIPFTWVLENFAVYLAGTSAIHCML